MKSFWIRTVNVLLAVGVLLGFNLLTEVRQKETEIARLDAQVETLQLELDAEKNYQSLLEGALGQETVKKTESVDEAAASRFKDGTYSGSSQGFGGLVTVEVTIAEDEITDIAIVSAPGEDKAYLSMAEKIIPSILEQQTTEVDTISGATFSSTGIKNAVTIALSEAEQ